MSRQSSLDIGLADADGLENLPGMTNYFDPNDLKGVLADMPEYKPDKKIMDPSTLDKFMAVHHNAQDLSKIDNLSHPEQSKTSPDNTAEASSSHNTLNHRTTNFDIHGGIDTRSNPETPTEELFATNSGSAALKRVQSEQGTRTSARSNLNSPVLRFGEAAMAPSLNSSMINTVVSQPKPWPAHGLPDSQSQQKSNLIYSPQSGPSNCLPRAVSRLRESTPMSSESQHSKYDLDLHNTIYHHDQKFGNNQHTEFAHYPDPSLSYKQHSLSQTPYTNQEIHGNVNRSTYEPVQFHPGHDLQLAQTLTIPNQRQMAPTQQKTFKQEYPEYGTDLAYSSYQEAEQDRGTNTMALNDTTVPRDEADKRIYVKMLQDAMMNMDDAEDNSGMISTWNKMRQDKYKVEQACWALVV